MHDYVSYSKFTTKPCLHKILLNLWYVHAVYTCHWVFFSSLMLWKFVHGKIYKIYMYQYCNIPVNFLIVIVFRYLSILLYNYFITSFSQKKV